MAPNLGTPAHLVSRKSLRPKQNVSPRQLIAQAQRTVDARTKKSGTDERAETINQLRQARKAQLE